MAIVGSTNWCPMMHRSIGQCGAAIALAAAWWAVSTVCAEPPSPKGDAPRRPSLVVTPNQFKGTDVERINQAIDAAASLGCRVVIPRVNVQGEERREVWLLDSAILVRSNTTLELDNCRIKLSDRCRDNMIRSANCGLGITDIRPMQNIHIRGIGTVVLEGADHPRATGDSGKTLGERTYGTDAGKSTARARPATGATSASCWPSSRTSASRTSPSRTRTAGRSPWSDVPMARCETSISPPPSSSMIDGVRQTILNQDGIDLRMGCHDILIENITGYTGDDLIALTAIPKPAASRAEPGPPW